MSKKIPADNFILLEPILSAINVSALQFLKWPENIEFIKTYDSGSNFFQKNRV